MFFLLVLFLFLLSLQVSTTDSQTPFVQGESGEDGGGNGGGEDGGGGGGGSLCCFGGGITNKEAGNEVFHLQKKAKVAPMVSIGEIQNKEYF